MVVEQNWVIEARKHLGVSETKGPKTSGIIAKWLNELNAWWHDDETAWCGVFVAHCIKSCGLSVPKYWMRAKAWAEWGEKLPSPVPGCIVIFEREGGGHVGFVVGRTVKGNLMVLGGNQGDCVCIKPFDRSRVLAYVWPSDVPMPFNKSLLVMESNSELSVRES